MLKERFKTLSISTAIVAALALPSIGYAQNETVKPKMDQQQTIQQDQGTGAQDQGAAAQDQSAGEQAQGTVEETPDADADATAEVEETPDAEAGATAEVEGEAVKQPADQAQESAESADESPDTKMQAETATEDDAAKQTDRLAASGSIFITEELDGDITATDFIGQTVYNRSGENVGDINDLVIGEDGSLKAAIVGVGGFLGLGEKDVAVAFEAIESRREPETDRITLMVDASKEELEAAPEFETIEMKVAADQAAQPPVQQSQVDPAAKPLGEEGQANEGQEAPANN